MVIMLIKRHNQLWEDFMEMMASLLDVAYEMPVPLQLKAAEQLEESVQTWKEALQSRKKEEQEHAIVKTEKVESASITVLTPSHKEEKKCDVMQYEKEKSAEHSENKANEATCVRVEREECTFLDGGQFEHEADDVPIPVKRGRGRPRKYPIAESLLTKQDLVTARKVNDDDDDDYEPNPKPVKRPRGRPPRQVYGLEEQKSKPFTCSVCSKSLSAQSSLETHMRIHTGERPYVCELCGKSFTQISGLTMHKKTHSGICDCQCKYCDYTAKQSIDILRHEMRHHSSQRPFLCEICGKGFVEVWSLQLHRTTHNKEQKDCVCDICDFRTHNIGILRSHKRNMHSENRPTFECKVCGAKLRYRDTYEGHMRRHYGQKPYKCEECGAAFASTSQLAAHKHIHGEREFECSVCNKRFVSRHKLARHAVIHTDSKLFACPVCGYRCNVKSNLKKHCHFVHRIEYPPAGMARVKRINANKTMISHNTDNSLAEGTALDGAACNITAVSAVTDDTASHPAAASALGTAGPLAINKVPEIIEEFLVIDSAADAGQSGDNCTSVLRSHTKEDAGDFLLFITECGGGDNIVMVTENGSIPADPSLAAFHEVTVTETSISDGSHQVIH